MADYRDRMKGLEEKLRGPASQRRMNSPSARVARRLAKKDFAQARKVVKNILEDGPGLLTDRELRSFFLEVTKRFWEHGPGSFPSSFNVFEAFLSYDTEKTMFRLRPERDHMFSFADFIDYYTGSDFSADFDNVLNLPEGVIHSYATLDDPHDLVLNIHRDGGFAFGGVAMVRQGDELSLMMICGQTADLDVEGEKLAPLDGSVPWTVREHIRPAEGLASRAEPLGEHADLWKHIVFTRLNLRDRTEQVRYVLRDDGNRYHVVTDDPVTFLDLPSTESERLLSESAAQLDSDYAGLFELAKTLTALPSYFRFKITLVRDEQVRRHPIPAHGKPKEHSAVTPSPRVVYKRVAALRVVGSSSRTVRRFSAPAFRVEVGGFWRQLPIGQLGTGPVGERVEGRTWVKAHLRWREKPDRPMEVLVKSRVSIARAIAEADRRERSVDASATVAPAGDVAGSVNPASPRQRVSREAAYRERQLLTARLRWKILQRDNFRCGLCGADAARDHSVRLDVDHIIPVSEGGRTEAGNLRTLCSRCNNGKGADLP